MIYIRSANSISMLTGVHFSDLPFVSILAFFCSPFSICPEYSIGVMVPGWGKTWVSDTLPSGRLLSDLPVAVSVIKPTRSYSIGKVLAKTRTENG